MNCLSYGLWLIHGWCSSTIKHLLFMATGQIKEKVTGQLYFFAMISYVATRLFDEDEIHLPAVIFVTLNDNHLWKFVCDQEPLN